MLRTTALAAALCSIAAVAQAAPATSVTLEGKRIFPESITSTKNGDIYVGAYGTGAVYRIKPGATNAGVWLDPAKTGIKAALGVFADESTNTLFVCQISPQEGPSDPANANLHAFDLKTGDLKAKIPMLSPAKAVCNDMEIGKDGALYVTDTGNSAIYRLARGAKQLEPWLVDPKLGRIDGIAAAADGFYVNDVGGSKLFHIGLAASGKPGAVTELKPSMPIAGPDGMRKLGPNRFLLAENSTSVGRIDEVTVTGDQATIRVIHNDPGVTAMTLVGDRIWIDNAKFAYRVGQPLASQTPEPFVIYSVPLR